MLSVNENLNPRRIVFTQPGQAELQTFELPALASDSILVKTHFSLMSPGSEMTILNGTYAPDSHFAEMFSFPQYKTGNLAVGEILDAGSGVSGLAPGDRVFMRMAHGSHQIVPAATVSPVPDAVDSRDACWCGLARTAFRAAWAAQFDQHKSVLVIGVGPVGQMLVRWANAHHTELLVAMDTSNTRLKCASQGGAKYLIGQSADKASGEVEKLSGGDGFDIVVDCTGNASVFKAALKAAGQYGRILLLGDTGYPGEQRLTSDVMKKGLTIQATHESHVRDGWSQRRVDKQFFELVTQDKFSLSGLISHEFDPTDCRAAYDLVRNHRSDVLGVAFNWYAGH